MKLLPSTVVTMSFFAMMFIVYTPFFGSAAPHGEIQELTGKRANDQVSHRKLPNAAELSVLKNKISTENLMQELLHSQSQHLIGDKASTS